MAKYLLIPLDDTVVFPNMTVTLPLDTGSESRVLLVPRHEGVYAKVGTVAEIEEGGRLPGGARVVTLTGLHRALLGAAEAGSGGRLYVEVEERPDEAPPPVKTRELETEYRAVVQEILELRDADPRIGEFLRSVAEPGALADTAAYSPDLTFQQRVELLTEEVLALLRLRTRLDIVADAASHLQLGQALALVAQRQLEALGDVEGLQQLDLLLEGQVRGVAGGVGQRAGLGDRAHPGGDAPVVATQLEDLLDRGAVLALQLARAAVDRLFIGMLGDLDDQPSARIGVRGAGAAAGDALEHGAPGAARKPDALGNARNRPDGGVLALVTGNEEHLLGVADVDRQRDVHRREDNGVVEGDEQ